MSGHISVLLQESVAALDIRPDGWYVDATFGRGGHSRAILAQLNADGRLFALDRDAQAAAEAAKIADPRFYFARSAFGNMEAAFAAVSGWQAGCLQGVLFDLGVSSPQLDEAARGFSFSKEGPLDMRMDQESGISARDWLLGHSEADFARIIRDLGDEPHTIAKRIAKAVYERRERLHTTTDLAVVVAEAMPKKFYRPNYHPATQTFQALRMAVNDELGEIQRGLNAAVKLLAKGGVLAVISFHGGEDALVKRFIREQEGEALPAEIPSNRGRVNQVLELINPVVKPSAQDVAANPRCRSARLRKAVKV